MIKTPRLKLLCATLAAFFLLSLAIPLATTALHSPIESTVAAQSGSSAGGGRFRSRRSRRSSFRRSRSSFRRSRSSFRRSRRSRSSFGSPSYRRSRRSSSYNSGGYGDRGYGGGGYNNTPTYNNSGGGGGCSCIGVLIFLVVVGGIVGFVIYSNRKKSSGGGGGGGILGTSSSGEPKDTDVTRVQLGVRIAARNVQDQLEGLARMSDLDSDEGLLAFMHEIVLALRRNKDHIEYGHIELSEFMTMRDAEATFRSWTMEARSKYNREVLRRDHAGVREQQKEVDLEHPGLLDEDGDMAVAEFFVVTLVVCEQNRGPMPDRLDHWGQLEHVFNGLTQISAMELIAVEVIWSPAAMSDALGKDEMMYTYPEMGQL